MLKVATTSEMVVKPMHNRACKQPVVTAGYPFMGALMGNKGGLW